MTPRSLLEPARLAGTPLLRSQSDERLVDLTRAGNTRAFEAIVYRYRRPLMRYCERLLPRGQAEDTVQLAFIRAFEAIQRDAGELNLRPWLYRIAHNAAVDVLRRGERGHEQLDPNHDGVERPDQALERSEHLALVLGAVRQLPERQRNAVVLRELEGRSYSEIAAELGVSGGAVRQLLNRARANLRAAATALTPTPLVSRIAGAETESVAARVAEICAGGGTAVALSKAGAAALVTGAVAGGVAAPELPLVGGPSGGERGAAAAVTSGDRDGGEGDSPARPGGNRSGEPQGGERDGLTEQGAHRGESEQRDDREQGSDDRRSEDGDRRGTGGGALDEHDSSGPGSGGDGGHDSSGPGSGREGDSSGPGSGGEPELGDQLVPNDNAGSGSGSGSSGSSRSGSGSGEPDPVEDPDPL